MNNGENRENNKKNSSAKVNYWKEFTKNFEGIIYSLVEARTGNDDSNKLG